MQSSIFVHASWSSLTCPHMELIDMHVLTWSSLTGSHIELIDRFSHGAHRRVLTCSSLTGPHMEFVDRFSHGALDRSSHMELIDRFLYGAQWQILTWSSETGPHMEFIGRFSHGAHWQVLTMFEHLSTLLMWQRKISEHNCIITNGNSFSMRLVHLFSHRIRWVLTW